MSTSLLLEAENKLAADHDGSYKAQLITELEKYRDEFALARQGFLPPDEHKVAEEMEAAVTAALTIINVYEPAKSDSAPDLAPTSSAFSPMTNI